VDEGIFDLRSEAVMATRKTSKVTKRSSEAAGKHAARKAVAKAKPARKKATAGTKPAAKRTAARKTAGAVARGEQNVYRPQAIEAKWQKRWEADQLYRSVIDSNRPKHYALTMLPYPSGNMHIGHWYTMTPSDARARFMRMKGYNVLFPMGFDAFGLPAENAAISRGTHPKKWTYQNIDQMRTQLKSMGTMFDWQREAISSDPEYYRWTQWLFAQLFKRGLAYRKLSAVDWCPKDNTTLAREQVVGEGRVCERCGTPVIKKNLEQWFFKTTSYVDELLDFSTIDWPEPVQSLQTNWIGRSEGASVTFKTESGEAVEVFTTRPDTLWGATFMVFSPEHPLVGRLTTARCRAEVETYQAEASRKTDIDREAVDKDKTGVFTGGYAINPVNEERIPIWIADYVLNTYGTGAIMAVPAHDARDFAFARKYGLKVAPVIQPAGVVLDGEKMEAAHEGEGVMINSGQFDGTPATNDKGMKNPAIKAVTEWLEQQGIGRRGVNYRLRDWLISRQRYWGAPIPMVHCEKHGWNPVPDDQLPVLLPDDVQWRPTGESPLKLHPKWKDTKCPVCGEAAVRETDTMDTFMCSSWYHLRYLSPHYTKGLFEQAEYDYWMPVDSYTGGIEHATMHLIYTRFFHKALRDMGIVEGGEPMLQLRNQGQILGPDGQRMSKSRGNVVDPDKQVRSYGTDTVRAFMMFGYRWSEGGPWTMGGIEGTGRWLRRVWAMFTEAASTAARPEPSVTRDLRRKVHQTLQSVTRDFERFEFNTIISSLMELLNEMQKSREAGAAQTPEWAEATDIYLRMLAPVCPHIAEEIWTQRLGKPYSVHQQAWPTVDAAAAKEDVIEIPVQVNGKVRDRITVPAEATEATIRAAALASEAVQKYLEGRQPKQVIVVQKRLVSVVI
jgi:leucyl-tRNA synthetase